MKDEGGFALVITLLITALLVALAVEFVDEVFVDTSARQNFTDGQQASIMASSGIDLAVKGLQLSAGRGYNSLADLWAQPFKKEDEKGTLVVTVEDESGKLNLNKVSGSNGQPARMFYEAAKRLFKNQGLSLDLLDTLTDWVDDRDVSPQSAGAKNPYYNTLKPPYDAKSGRLETIDELRLVKGFDAETVNRLRKLVTVYPDCDSININTAPEEVIAALLDGMTDVAKNVVVYRKTTPYKKVDDLGNVPGIASGTATGLQGYASVNGTVYRVLSTAKVNDTTRTVEAVVRASDWHTLYWREY